MVHTCVTMKKSVAKRVSRPTSFEIGLSRIVLIDTSVLTLGPHPCIEGWYMHPLSNGMGTRGFNALIEP